MLDSNITGIRSIDDIRDSLGALSAGDIFPRSRVFIYRNYQGNEYGEEVFNVTSYETSEDKELGASSLTIDATNKNGLYSYNNTSSAYNKLHIYDATELTFDIADGTHNNTEVANGVIVLKDVSKMGTWISGVLSAGQNFYRWEKLKWVIDLKTDTKDDKTVRSAVNLFYRVTNSDGEWGPWIKIRTLKSNLISNPAEKMILEKGQSLQVKADLFPGEKTVSPAISLISVMCHNLTDGANSVISNQPLYYYGNRIEVREYIVSADGLTEEELPVFNGFIDEVMPAHIFNNSSLTCSALGFMKMCLSDFIEKPSPDDMSDKIFEPDLLGMEEEEIPDWLNLFGLKGRGGLRIAGATLEPVMPDDDPEGIPMTEDEINSVFRLPDLGYRNNGPIRGYENVPPEDDEPKSRIDGDKKYLPWVQRPAPLVVVDGKPVSSGYQIDHERGVVYFGEKKENPNTHEPLTVAVKFFWYDLDTNLYEDVVGEILAEAIKRFGFEKPERVVRTNDYDIWRADSHDIEIILERSKPRTTIPRMSFSLDDNKTFYDALVDVNKYITPDYYLRATPEGKFVGEYLPQKATKDYSLTLVGELTAPVSDEEVYTKCIARGIQPSVKNIAMVATFKWVKEFNKSDPNYIYPNYHKPGSNYRSAEVPTTGIVDGDFTTNVGWQWESKTQPVAPQEMVRFTFDEPIDIGAINILVGDGAGQPKEGSGNKYGAVNLNGFGLRVEVSKDAQLWYTITSKDFDGSSGEWICIDDDNMLPDITGTLWKHIRILATNMVKNERGSDGIIWGLFGKTSMEVWNWALREVQIYPSEVIRADVTVDDLVSDEIIQFPASTAEDLKKRIGTKTIVLPIDGGLRTEDEIKTRAKYYLFDCCRNLYTSTAQVVYAPHCRVGHTVGLKSDLLLDGEQLYYVNAVRKSMDGGIPSVTVDLVKWA